MLVVAGGLLRSATGQDEQDVLYRALRDFNVPKILAQVLWVGRGTALLLVRTGHKPQPSGSG